MKELIVKKLNELGSEEREKILSRANVDFDKLETDIRAILEKVRTEKDKALYELTEKFDNCKLDSLKVSEEEIEEAKAGVDNELKETFEHIKRNLESFYSSEKPVEWFKWVDKGIYSGMIYRPYDRVGVYIPGKKALFPTIVLRICVPALVAGVKELVICSPPDHHLHQIKMCLDHGMHVMCEKPLCGIGQIDQAEELLDHPLINRVMVTYNYRYNPDLTKIDNDVRSDRFMLNAYQHRDNLPSWGLLLDHVGHDADTLRYITKENLVVTHADYAEDSFHKLWSIHGVTYDSRTPFSIHEEVLSEPSVLRMAQIITPFGTLEMTPNPEMFTEMWYDFLEKVSYGEGQNCGFENAILTQQVLEDAYRVYNAKKEG